MPVVVEHLLPPAPKAKARAAPTQTVAGASPGGARKEAEFARVYAREQQDKSVERAAQTANAKRENSAEAAQQSAESAALNRDAEPLAASGNGLPADPVSDTDSADVVDTPADEADEALALQTELDPLMLLTLSGQLPVVPPSTSTAWPMIGFAAPTEASLTGQTALLAGEAGSGVATRAGVDEMPEASHDAPFDTLSGASDEPTVEVLLAAFKPEESGEESAEALNDVSPVQLRENLTTRLTSLTQVVAQPAAAASRLSLLPGPPLALQQGGWSEAVLDKVMWLSSQNLKSAEIQLDPANLGRLEVRVEISKEQTQVTFASPHAGVRETLEGQMQRLRDLFTEQGMNLLDVNVSDQSLQRGWQGQGQSNASNGAQRGDDVFAAVGDESLSLVTELLTEGSVNPRGLVDYYA